MLKEFREFAIRGNVVDLAVGVIIGAAFGAVVTSLVNDVIMPPIGLVARRRGLLEPLRCAQGGREGRRPVLPAWPTPRPPAPSRSTSASSSTPLINFVIVAFAVFMVVKGVNAARRRRRRRRSTAGADAAGEAPDRDPRSDEGARLSRRRRVVEEPAHARSGGDHARQRRRRCGSARASRIAAAFSRPNATTQSSDDVRQRGARQRDAIGAAASARRGHRSPTRLLDRATDAGEDRRDVAVGADAQDRDVEARRRAERSDQCRLPVGRHAVGVARRMAAR